MTVLAASPLPRVKRYEQIVERIERMIASAELAPGQALPCERDICEQFGVGRTAVREALITLERRGMIVIQNGERARIARPTAAGLLEELGGPVRVMLTEPGSVAHLQDMRALVEVGLAKQAARRATPADVAELRAALEVNRESMDDEAAFARSDVAFHAVIARIGGNPLIVSIVRAFNQWLEDQRVVALRAPGSARTAYRFHARLAAAIAAGDPDAAERVMSRHLESVKRFYRLGASAGEGK